MRYDPFWFQIPKHPSWKFVQVLVKPWEQPDINEVAEIFKLLVAE